MNIIMIGTGYVGLVSGACLASLGHTVTCVDIDPAKIDSLEKGGCPLYENGLPELLKTTQKSGNLTFSLGLPESLEDADAVFLGVGTPQGDDGKADMRFINAAFGDVLPKLYPHTVVVTKSTVPVGTADRLLAWMKTDRPELPGHIASNPEFLREGTAVQDFLKPDRIVSGANTEHGTAVLKAIYQPLEDAGHPHLQIDPQSAELAKYAANAFLATKISFINEMAGLCEHTKADVGAVAQAMGMDNRIGKRFLRAGPGYGGSCFPKDTSALTHIAKEAGIPVQITQAAIDANTAAQERVIEKISNMTSLEGKTIACLGLTFKADTDDMRDSPALTILPALQAKGAHIKAIDPAGMSQAKKLLDITFCDSVATCLAKSDIVIMMTEWPEYTGLNPADICAMMNQHASIADLRRVWTPERLKQAGFKNTYVLGS